MLFSKFDITRRGASTIGEFKRRGRRGKKYCNYARYIYIYIHMYVDLYIYIHVEEKKPPFWDA